MFSSAASAARYVAEKTEEFRQLIESRGLTVTNRTPARPDNDYAVVTFEDSALRIRISRDRGDQFVELASRLEPENWYALDTVMRAVNNAPLEISGPGLSLCAAILEQNFAAIRDAFMPERWPATRGACEARHKAVHERFEGFVKNLEQSGYSREAAMRSRRSSRRVTFKLLGILSGSVLLYAGWTTESDQLLWTGAAILAASLIFRARLKPLPFPTPFEDISK
jgi:hypothetical protein